MKNVRELCDLWYTKTYKEGLLDLSLEDRRLEEQALKIFNKLGIIDLPMDGYSCEKLPKTEESKIKIKKTYSEIFHDELENDSFSPASYLVQIIKEYGEEVESKIEGITARGLRTFTSLLREIDFADQLKRALIPYDENVTTNSNPKQDSSDHTDVFLTYNGIAYRIWLYQFSARGLPHDIERLTGKRGELPDGIHIICPLHTEIALPYISLSKSIKTKKERLAKCEQNLKECSERAIKKRETIESQIKNYSLQLHQKESLCHKEDEITKKELDIINGWFFYSESYIKRTVDYINNLKPINYTEVVEILSGPERFVGTMQSFLKEN